MSYVASFALMFGALLVLIGVIGYLRSDRLGAPAVRRPDPLWVTREDAHVLGLPWVEADGSISTADTVRAHEQADLEHRRIMGNLLEHYAATSDTPPLTAAEWNAVVRDGLRESVGQPISRSRPASPDRRHRSPERGEAVTDAGQDDPSSGWLGSL